jgi:hypothetical protein
MCLLNNPDRHEPKKANQQPTTGSPMPNKTKTFLVNKTQCQKSWQPRKNCSYYYIAAMHDIYSLKNNGNRKE